MRNLRHIFFSALAIVMAGCNEDSLVPVSPIEPENTLEVYSDVPIEFGYGGMTKGMEGFVNPDRPSYFGIFTSLEGTSDLTKKGRLGIKDNMTIRYEEDFGFKFGYKSEDRVFFYPKSDDKYSFYAYFSHVNDARIHQTQDTLYLDAGSYQISRSKVYLHMTSKDNLSSSGEVLWAKAQSETDPDIDAFNADVVKSGHSPYFVFKRPMAKVSFTFTLAETTTLPLNDLKIRLEMMGLVNGPVDVDFCLVDTDGESEGTFENFVYPDVPTDYFWQDGRNIPNDILNDMFKMSGIRGLDGTANIACQFLAEDAGVPKVPGKGCFMVPPTDQPLVCRMRFGIYKNAETMTASGYHYFDVTLDPADYGYEGGYKSGVHYTYNIVVDYRRLLPSYGVNGPYVKGKWLNINQYTKQTE